MEAALTGICGVLFVCVLFSAVWLFSLPVVCRCDCCHCPGSHLGLLWLFVLGFCFLALIAERIKQNPKTKTSRADLGSPGPPFRRLTNSRENIFKSSRLMFAFVFSFKSLRLERPLNVACQRFVYLIVHCLITNKKLIIIVVIIIVLAILRSTT